jgi:hypothetical protein
MPLQNRVSPRGEIIVSPARGTFMGNRGGVLHNERRQIVRPYASRRWITCLLEFKGRRRTVMSPGRYTELFFLDEAVALAAGHRPCAECRRDRFNAFRDAWERWDQERAAPFQHQRPTKTASGLSYIEATRADIAAADRLMSGLLKQSLDELPPQTRKLLELVEAMVAGRAGSNFSRRDIREHTQWGHTQLKIHLHRLEELEYLAVH